MGIIIDKEKINTLYESRFIKCFDIQYREGKHYYEASRREKEDLVVRKSDRKFKEMLPDAVSIAVILHLPGNETRLLLSYEYRYPVGQFLLSPVAGLLDPEDKKCKEPLIHAAIREIKEEIGLTIKDRDKVYVMNSCAFSSPGMTDESNAFLCAEIVLESMDEINQSGAQGSELFDGNEILDKESAQNIFMNGRDKNGNYYSLATWMILGIYINMF